MNSAYGASSADELECMTTVSVLEPPFHFMVNLPDPLHSSTLSVHCRQRHEISSLLAEVLPERG